MNLSTNGTIILHSGNSQESIILSTFGAAVLTFVSLLAAGLGLLAKYIWSQYQQQYGQSRSNAVAATEVKQDDHQQIVINIQNTTMPTLGDSTTSSSTSSSLIVPVEEREMEHIKGLWDVVRDKMAEGKLKPVVTSPRQDDLTPRERFNNCLASSCRVDIPDGELDKAAPKPTLETSPANTRPL